MVGGALEPTYPEGRQILNQARATSTVALCRVVRIPVGWFTTIVAVPCGHRLRRGWPSLFDFTNFVGDNMETETPMERVVSSPVLSTGHLNC